MSYLTNRCYFHATTVGFRASIIVVLFSSLFLHAVTADVIGDPTGTGEHPQDLLKKGDGGIADLLDPVLRLNRFTFEKTILEDQTGQVSNWMVLFCPPWYEPCQAIDPLFRSLTSKWQERLNSALLSTEVRFAAVDCATEKALCNTQNVNTYPFVAHYQQGKQVHVWRGKSFASDPKRLRDFLQKVLGPAAASLSETGAKDSSAEKLQDVTAEGGSKIPTDFLLIFATIAGNAWFISRGSGGSEASSNTTPSSRSPKGLVPSSSSGAEHPSSCVTRSLPKEWGRDRPSLEL